MITVAMYVLVAVFCVFVLAVSIALLVVLEVITPQEVRRWLFRKTDGGNEDG